jgi:hypothetical protein
MLLVGLLGAVCLAGAQEEKEHGSRPKEGGDPEAMADFGRVMAVQANDAQQEKFPDLTHEANTAVHAAQQLVQNAKDKAMAQNARESIEHLRNDVRAFLKDLTKPQRSGLKPELQKLSKSENEMEKATAGAGDNPTAAQNLLTAVQHYQSDLAALADQMGIKSQK